MLRRPDSRARGVVGLVTGLVTGLVLGIAVLPVSDAAPAAASTSETPSPSGTATPVAPSPSPSTEPTPESARDPLRVVIRRLQPAVLPEDPRAKVTVAGTVTNRSGESWSVPKVYLLTSSRPMTSAEELTAGVDSDPGTDLGGRIVETGTFDELPDLRPGTSARFTLSVPRRLLQVTGEPGVYWLSVQVLATPEDGQRDHIADGRARTFFPFVPRGTEGTELALAAQFRARVVRDAEGRLAFPDHVAHLLTHDGRLARLLALSRTAKRGDLSWIVDPALVEAAASVADGNPAFDAPRRSLPAIEGEGGSDTAVPSPGSGPATDGATDGATEGATGDETGSGVTDGSGATTDEDPQARRATRWLTRWSDEADSHEVFAVPYGDLDVASAYSHARAALATYALDVSARVLDALGVSSEPVVVPPTGYLPEVALAELPSRVLAVLAPEAVPRSPRPLLRTPNGTAVLVAGTAATTRGPGPGATRSALAVRQRLLAESALHALSADRGKPVVAVLPTWWDPGRHWRAAHLIDGLSQPWLELVDVAQARRDAGSAELPLPQGVVYPEDQAAAELDSSVLQATETLIAQGATYESVFVDIQSVGDRLSRQALLHSSLWSRAHPRLAAHRARTAAAVVEMLLDKVAVRSPPLVTLSSGDGAFLVSLVNGLDQRVRVGLRATVSGRGMRLGTPETVTLEPKERRSVRVTVQSSGIGVHRAVLQPITETGLPVGRAAVLSVRSSSVGLVLWLIMAGGAVVLFGAIAVRIVRRVRRRRATHGPVLRDRVERLETTR